MFPNERRLVEAWGREGKEGENRERECIHFNIIRNQIRRVGEKNTTKNGSKEIITTTSTK